MIKKIETERVKKGQGGFTLVELLVVVLIIGVLASIGIPQYFKVVERSRAGEIQDNMGTIQSAEERYMAKNGGYDTGDFSQFDIVVPNTGTGTGGTGTFTSATGYMRDYTVTLAPPTGTGGYKISYVRAGNVPAAFGNYIITYDNCGNGQACTVSDTGCTDTKSPSMCLQLVQ